MKPEDPNAFTVRHDQAKHRFEVVSEDFVSVLDYESRAGRVVFTHTFVPPELRGRGLAEKLVRAGLDWARTERVRVVPVCSYVAAFIERHPEFRDLVAE